ncbi:hypothetical protein [Mycolicibacterium gilvum]|uniref:Uncharacterized protein n=1 Tax=Mycolicibacterium gilvum (strain DSM 45189 / LMG 24558 / Spyr1) TaxID=278137 RepID=E6TH05_MYCSR|nr:hypothetical protein [Mycolicibacterium gilvum]ADT97885.1 hypothetical protein Mspyr1_12040 [Mycolicibacterium gilvum Spyr1]
MKYKFDEIEPAPAPDDEFWLQRDVLTHVRDFARSRRANPYAVLGNVMRRAVACVEPHVVLPPLTGSVVSVNLFTSSVGRSGQGKGVADGAGNDAITFVDEDGVEIETARPNVGTGEGLARLFKGRKEIGDPPPTRAEMTVPEVGTLAAIAGRQGATLVSEILKAFMGEPLGFNNNSKDTTTAIAAHSYRLSLGVGVQPENADFFLSREKDGLPQRFLWFPVVDPDAPEARPAPVDPITVTIPRFPVEVVGDGDNTFVRHVRADVPGEIADEIDAFRYRVLVGDGAVDPLDGHLMLTRLKAAFALAVLNGQRNVSADDWKLAGELIDVSKRVRAELAEVLAEKHRRENKAKAMDAADREAIIAARLSEDKQKRVAQAITRKLERADEATRKELRQACTAAIRDDFDTVFAVFIDKQFIVCCETEEGHAARYRLAG